MDKVKTNQIKPYIPSMNYVVKKGDQYFCPKCDDWLFNTRCVHMAVCPNCGIQLDWDKEVAA